MGIRNMGDPSHTIQWRVTLFMQPQRGVEAEAVVANWWHVPNNFLRVAYLVDVCNSA